MKKHLQKRKEAKKVEAAKINNLYDLNETKAADYLKQFEYPWEALSGIGDMIIKIGESLDPEIYEKKGENIWIAKSAKVWPTVSITGPCIIGERTEVRQCAFIRGKALVGDDCVVGNSTELKNVILFNHVQVPHYNYVGDSILGYYSHMGAGSITSNVKSDKALVVVKSLDGEKIETGLKKFGAMLGDHVEIGCNSVLNPGTVVGRGSNVYPTSCVRGVIPEGSIYKAQDNIVKRS
ncbi:MAG: UDP-N-acetylglucosamine pyrophosphorylase [Lachnospiraceae bacterium]|nr:UDP-N-acetylglucosamine pyrophosphorylase [Lachnospiraceae bacterium]